MKTKPENLFSKTETEKLFHAFIVQRLLLKHSRSDVSFFVFPILKDYKFCNINREDDRVTKYIAEYIRNQHYPTTSDALAWLLLARCLNEPDSIKGVLFTELLIRSGRFSYLSTPAALLHTHEFYKRRNPHKKIFRGAYMVNPHGVKNIGVPTFEYVLCMAIELIKKERDTGFASKAKSLGELANDMLTIDGLGEFMTNQVLTDLRYMPNLSGHFPDLQSFVLCGPGTRRGIDRFDRKTVDCSNEEKQQLGTKKQDYYVNRLLTIREQLWYEGELPTEVQIAFKDPNNLANSFCEFDKFCRATNQLKNNQRITLKKYKPYEPELL